MLMRFFIVCAAALVLAAPAAADEPAAKDGQPVVQTELGAQVEQFLNEPVVAGGMSLAMTPGDIFTWVFVGVLAGTLAAMVFTRRESGFGHMANLGVGLLGALIGGFVLSVLPFRVDMGALVIGVNELIAAFAGSVALLVFTMWLSAAQKGRGRQAKPEHGKKGKAEEQKRRAA
jgi:uncharacterized membrane protein YeaQ/YmgE (transglycosylase-associated protein family)